VAEYLDEAIGCRALFATHYHELVAVAEASPHAAAHSVGAKEIGGDVVFLHRLAPGGTSRSYGIAVAKLAGLPEPVLARARALLAGLEGQGKGPSSPRAKPTARGENQLDLFAPGSAPSSVERELAETLKALDVDRLTGLEALELIARFKRRL
jgi:DNA mismatch repair protein MutS